MADCAIVGGAATLSCRLPYCLFSGAVGGDGFNGGCVFGMSDSLFVGRDCYQFVNGQIHTAG